MRQKYWTTIAAACALLTTNMVSAQRPPLGPAVRPAASGAGGGVEGDSGWVSISMRPKPLIPTFTAIRAFSFVSLVKIFCNRGILGGTAQRRANGQTPPFTDASRAVNTFVEQIPVVEFKFASTPITHCSMRFSNHSKIAASVAAHRCLCYIQGICANGCAKK